MSHNKKRKQNCPQEPTSLDRNIGEGAVAKWPAAGKGKACSNAQKRKVLKTWQVKHKQEIKNLMKN